MFASDQDDEGRKIFSLCPQAIANPCPHARPTRQRSSGVQEGHRWIMIYGVGHHSLQKADAIRLLRQMGKLITDPCATLPPLTELVGRAHQLKARLIFGHPQWLASLENRLRQVLVGLLLQQWLVIKGFKLRHPAAHAQKDHSLGLRRKVGKVRTSSAKTGTLCARVQQRCKRNSTQSTRRAVEHLPTGEFCKRQGPQVI